MASDVPVAGGVVAGYGRLPGMRPGDFFLATKDGRYDDLGWASVCPTCPVGLTALAHALRAPGCGGVGRVQPAGHGRSSPPCSTPGPADLGRHPSAPSVSPSATVTT